MTTGELIHEKRAEILHIAASHGAHSVRLFGSVARGEERPDSDVDFLVELEDGRSLFDLGELVMDLQDLLGRSVDVVEPAGLYWFIRERVLNEAVPI